jgi:predicted nucleotidyltransferase
LDDSVKGKYKMEWHADLLEKLVLYFEPDKDVLGLLLFGSYSKPDSHYDTWSDIDILLVIKNEQLRKFFPTIEWLDVFGKLYTYTQSTDEFKCTTRACFENFNRIDFVITTEEKLMLVNNWSSIPFSTGIKILFSRSKIVDEVARQSIQHQEFSPATEDQFFGLVRNFRFKSMLAVYKVVRNDLLIALHLTQDLIRDCCVLGMLLRDRATGTNIHKHSAIGNQLVVQLEITQQPFTAIGILDSIKASNEIFEKLACEWSPTYQENRQLLLNWIDKAKAELDW